MKSPTQLTSAELEQLARLKRQIDALVNAAQNSKESWFVECASGNNVIRLAVDPRDVEKLSQQLIDRVENEVDKIVGYV